MKRLEAFFRELDAHWRPTAAERVRLSIIGSAALLLQTDYERGTKDSDVLRTRSLDASIEQQLLALAGRDTRIHQRHRLYIDIVAGGLPFLAHTPLWHRLDYLSTGLGHFDLEALDVVDVVVSKLKRFTASDQSDIAAMIERGLVPHDRLIARFEAAVNGSPF